MESVLKYDVDRLFQNEKTHNNIGNEMTLNMTFFADDYLETANLNSSNAADEFNIAITIPEALLLTIVLGAIMSFTVIGNALVIMSVFTYRPLRNVQNMFLVSLAVADIAVALFVMPFNVAYNIMGRWLFGLTLCKMWLTSDVMSCTASILNLCAIALGKTFGQHIVLKAKSAVCKRAIFNCS